MVTQSGQYPVSRLRRTRMQETLRSMVRETELSKKDFIYPLFVVPGKGVNKEISSMPGVYQLSVDHSCGSAGRSMRWASRR